MINLSKMKTKFCLQGNFKDRLNRQYVTCFWPKGVILNSFYLEEQEGSSICSLTRPTATFFLKNIL